MEDQFGIPAEYWASKVLGEPDPDDDYAIAIHMESGEVKNFYFIQCASGYTIAPDVLKSNTGFEIKSLEIKLN